MVLSDLVLYLYAINLVLALGGLGLLVLTLALFYDYYLNDRKLYIRYVAQFAWPLIVATTVGGVALSLLYSEVFNFVPCSLCWLQRLALYPQALLSIMAFKMREEVCYPLYGIALSLFGLLVAVWQYIYQMLPSHAREGLVPCLADGSADCAEKVIDVFGFVTFPFLAAVTFLFLIILYLNLRRS